MTERADPSDDVFVLRVRDILDEQYIIIVALLLLVGLAGLWASYTVYIDPGTRAETQTVSEWRRAGAFDHRATVTTENPVYETGEEIRNQPAYFPRISPVLTGEYQFEYAASNGGNADVEISLRLIVRGMSDDAILWQQSRSIGSTRATNTSPGDVVSSGFQVDINQTRRQLERIDETFGQTPGTPVVMIQAQTRVTGQINGQVVNREFVDQLRFRPDGDSFITRDPGEVTNTSRQQRTVQVTRERSSALRIGGPVAMILGIGGAVGFIVARPHVQFQLTQSERDRLVHHEYTEWISYGSLQGDIDKNEKNAIEVSSLADLVDIAADTDTRVLYDQERYQYVVFYDDRTFICEPPLERVADSQVAESDEE